MHKPFLAISSLALTLATSAGFAADVSPMDQGYDWSGPYVGLHAGFLTSQSDVTDLGVLVEHNVNTDGFVGGGLVGYNFQKDSFVFGLEGDLGWSNAEGNGVGAPPDINTYNMNWDGHARLRLGFAPNQGPLLIYVAGGLAVADFKLLVGETGTSSASTYKGTSIGAGAEYGFSPNFVGRVEYIYDHYKDGFMGLGSVNLVAVGDYAASLKNVSTLRAAISFKF
jgi:outer membrane immunogenic protein